MLMRFFRHPYVFFLYMFIALSEAIVFFVVAKGYPKGVADVGLFAVVLGFLVAVSIAYVLRRGEELTLSSLHRTKTFMSVTIFACLIVLPVLFFMRLP
ncbi:hypothetical protein [Brevibacillus daliensis]|uniref:hypothetical protein n=1 Tax=Brevibacillus daliensis TaxID=2892995 RepID=UPI001E2F1606|nr:hypothetical protein [Brevibacillus daliensis]